MLGLDHWWSEGEGRGTSAEVEEGEQTQTGAIEDQQFGHQLKCLNYLKNISIAIENSMFIFLWKAVVKKK